MLPDKSCGARFGNTAQRARRGRSAPRWESPGWPLLPDGVRGRGPRAGRFCQTGVCHVSRALVPVEAQPVQVFIHGVNKFRTAALVVQVFIAEDKFAVRGAGTLPRHPEGARVSQVQVSGRRRRKPPAILYHGRPWQERICQKFGSGYFGLMATRLGGAGEPSDFLNVIGIWTSSVLLRRLIRSTELVPATPTQSVLPSGVMCR